MVQGLRLHIPNAGGPDLIPGQRTRSHMLQQRPSTAKIFLKKEVTITVVETARELKLEVEPEDVNELLQFQ